MAAWVVWLGVAVVLGVAEAFTLTAALGVLSGAALLAAGAAAVGLSVALQLIVFALTTAMGLALLSRRLSTPERFGVAALPGRTGHVVREVSGRGGLVRIGGEEWTARALDARALIPAGAAVQVLQVDGATVVVYPEE